MQAKEISALERSLASSQKLIEQMKNELVQAKALTKLTVSIIAFFQALIQQAEREREIYNFSC